MCAWPEARARRATASTRRSRRPSRRTSDAREAHVAHRHASAGAAAAGGAPPRQARTRAHSPGACGCAPEEEASFDATVATPVAADV
jgi:hypothetical protein